MEKENVPPPSPQIKLPPRLNAFAEFVPFATYDEARAQMARKRCHYISETLKYAITCAENRGLSDDEESCCHWNELWFDFWCPAAFQLFKQNGWPVQKCFDNKGQPRLVFSFLHEGGEPPKDEKAEVSV